MAFILPFTQLSKEDTGLAGGKGASLGEMTGVGIPVPPGFVVLSTAFDRFLEETDLNVEIDAILHKVNHKDVASVEKASEGIKALILNVKFPQNLKKEIITSFEDLNSEFVAVRSSATSEDSASAAWAGQLDSFLNTTEKTLLTNIQKCWASLFTPRAIFYRFEKGLHETKISVAVVIQKMINSEVSGIAFSVHPVTEDPNQLIIEAGLGLGEAIVSGQITPDSYVVEKEPFRIIDKNVNEQKRGMVRATAGGNKWLEYTKKQAASQKLSDADILTLSKLILKIETRYGFPCDIEWAKEGGKFFITQSRPITTLSNKKIGLVEPTRLKKLYTREHSLFYVSIWNDEDLLLIEDLFGFNLKNIVLVKNDEHYNVAGWWNEEELDGLYKKASEMINKDKKHFPWVKREFYKYLDKISPYLDHKKEIKNIKELKNYYKNWRLWFPLADMIFLLPSHLKVSKKITEETFKIREKTQHYTEEIDNIFISFFNKNYPQYSKFSLVLKPEEVFQLEKKAFSKLQILEFEKRIHGYALVNGEFVLINNLESELKKQNLILEADKVEHTQVLKGKSVYPGRVTGKVRVVLYKEDINKVKKGEIVVAEMTTPDYVPALKKAAAVITDEGGITCHAAIIARELKKPCIVGTKCATKILKDGDEIEMDATSGEVKKVKNFESLGGKKENKFIIKQFEARHSLFSVQWEAIKKYNNNFKTPILLDSGYFHKNDMGWWLGAESDYERARDYFIKNIEKDHNFAQIFCELQEVKLRSFLKNISQYKREIKKLTGIKEIKKWLESFTTFASDVTTASYSTDYFSYDSQFWRDYLGIKEDQFNRLVVPCRPGFIQTYKFDLASYVLRKSKLSINSLVKKYFWVLNNYFFTDILDKERLLKDLSEITPTSAKKIYEDYGKKFNQNQKSITTEINAIFKGGGSALAVIDGLRRLIDLQDLRKKVVLVTNSLLFEVYNKLLENYKFSEPDKQTVLNSAFYTWFFEKEAEDLLELSRQSSDGYLHLLNQDTSSTGQEADDFFKHIYDIKNETTKIIKGTTAYPGHIKGEVQIVLRKEDLAQFTKGKILVTSMTRPEMVSAMEKAAAFITDEGGITCHAAIVAREIKKPCIIGAKIATQVLHNGDVVEMNTDKGEVRLVTESGQTFQKLEDEIENTQWIKAHTRNLSLFTAEKYLILRKRHIPAYRPIYNYWQGTEKKTGLSPGKVYHLYSKGDYVAGIDKKRVSEVADQTLKTLLNAKPKELKRIRQQSKISGEKITSTISKFAQGIDKKKVKDYLNLFIIADKLYIEFFDDNMLYWLGTEEKIKTQIKNHLNSFDSSTQDEIIGILSRPVELSYASKIENEFTKILILVRKHGVDSLRVEKSIRTFVDKYVWFPYEYAGPKIYDYDTVKQRLREEFSSDTKHKLSTLEDMPQKQKLIIQKYNLDQETIRLFKIVQFLSLLQDDRKRYNSEACYLFNQVVLNSLAKKIAIPEKNIKYLDRSLLEKYIKQGSTKKLVAELESRCSYSLVEYYNGQTNFYYNKKADQVMEQEGVRLTTEILDTKSIKGVVAYAGKVIGIARIIKNGSYNKKLDHGDILISPMTTPDFLPLIKKVSAIVTDEGGMTCHAAIVARELKKPCIIGTHVATQVIKEGDKIEVDAIKGVINILK